MRWLTRFCGIQPNLEPVVIAVEVGPGGAPGRARSRGHVGARLAEKTVAAEPTNVVDVVFKEASLGRVQLERARDVGLGWFAQLRGQDAYVFFAANMLQVVFLLHPQVGIVGVAAPENGHVKDLAGMQHEAWVLRHEYAVNHLRGSGQVRGLWSEVDEDDAARVLMW